MTGIVPNDLAHPPATKYKSESADNPVSALLSFGCSSLLSPGSLQDILARLAWILPGATCQQSFRRVYKPPTVIVR